MFCLSQSKMAGWISSLPLEPVGNSAQLLIIFSHTVIFVFGILLKIPIKVSMTNEHETQIIMM